MERAIGYWARSPLLLLTGFQTPESIRTVGGGLISYVREHGAWPKGIPAPPWPMPSWRPLKGQTVRLPGEATTAGLIARLATHLLELDRQIKDCSPTGFRAHP